MRWNTPLIAFLALILSAHPGCTRPDTALASLPHPRGSAGWRVEGREAWRLHPGCDASFQLHATVEHSEGPRGCLCLRGGAGVDALRGGAANAGVDALAGALGDMKVGEDLENGNSVDPGTEKEDTKEEEEAEENGEEEEEEDSAGDAELAKLLAELEADFEGVGLSDAEVDTPILSHTGQFHRKRISL